FEKPNTHFEAEILRRQRAHRTNVRGVQRVIVVKNFARISGERVIAPAVHNTQRVVTNDVLCEADASRTKNAALIVEHNSRTELDAFGLMHLWLDKAAFGFAIID